MHAVILAGGAGTRLRPLTYAIRKELVPVVNRPLLEYRLRNLAQHGVRNVVVACSAEAREIEEVFGDGSTLSIHIAYAYEQQRLGSGRAVKEAARSVGATGTLVVCNGDIITNVDLTAMIARHRETGATLSMSLAPVYDPWTYGVAEVDEELRILSFVEKPRQGEEPSNLINAGTWLWEPEMLEMIPDDDSAAIDGFSERVLFPGIIADGLRVQGFQEDLWVDVGSPDRYFTATELLLQRLTRDEQAAILEVGDANIATSATMEGHVAVAPGVVVRDRAHIVGPTVLGPNVRIEEDATIIRSAVWDGAVVGPGARIEGSILAHGVTIGGRARMTGAVLGSGASVSDGVLLEDGARLMPHERA